MDQEAIPMKKIAAVVRQYSLSHPALSCISEGHSSFVTQLSCHAILASVEYAVWGDLDTETCNSRAFE